MKLYTCLLMVEVDTHTFRLLECIGTPVGSERSSGAENTQVVDAHSVAA